jgi:hypothetical protein
MANKILFLKMGSFSLINESIFKILESEFKAYTIDVVDVKDDILKKNMNYFQYIINIV